MLRQTLPVDGGVYVLYLHLEQETLINIGALGEVRFEGGVYLYIGSGFGPGGVRARLGRHLRGKGNMHWHIDALRNAARPVGFCYYIPQSKEQDRPLGEEITFQSYECRWSQALAALPAMSVPVSGFGASDCRMGCKSHLLMVVSGQSTSRFDHLMPVLAERLARSIHIKSSDLKCNYSHSAWEGH